MRSIRSFLSGCLPALLGAVVVLAGICVPTGACAASAAGKIPPGDDLFTNGPILRIAIDLTAASYESLRKEPRQKVAATVREGSRVYRDVAIHLKGALGSFQVLDAKPGLSLNFHSMTRGQDFHGLRKLMLNNSVQDPSYLNEKLAGDLFRAAGVPAPRTTHALVELNGRKLGLYVLKEGYGKEFLGLHFRRTDGNLYDLNQTFYDLGNGLDLEKRFRLDSGSTPEPLSDLAALISACNEHEPANLWSRLDTVLDLDRFISFMAMEILTCHSDGYSVYGHNVRLYHDPSQHKLVFIPHDMDRMFQECRPSLLNPNVTALAAAAVWRTPQGRQRYAERTGWICTNVFNLSKLTNQVNELSARLRPALASMQPQSIHEFDEQVRLVAARLRNRDAAIRRQFGSASVQPANGQAGH